MLALITWEFRVSIKYQPFVNINRISTVHQSVTSCLPWSQESINKISCFVNTKSKDFFMLTKHWYLVDLAGLLGSQSKFVALAKHKYFINCHLRLTNYWLFVTTGVDKRLMCWCLLDVCLMFSLTKGWCLMFSVFMLTNCWYFVDKPLMFCWCQKKVFIFCRYPIS